MNISTYLKMGFNMGKESLTVFLEMARELEKKKKISMLIYLFLPASMSRGRWAFGVYVRGALSRNT